MPDPELYPCMNCNRKICRTDQEICGGCEYYFEHPRSWKQDLLDGDPTALEIQESMKPFEKKVLRQLWDTAREEREKKRIEALLKRVRKLTKEDWAAEPDLECNCCGERPSYRDLKQREQGRPCDWCGRCVEGKCDH